MNEPEEDSQEPKKRNYPYWMLENHLERLREEWLDDVAPGVYWGPIGRLRQYGNTLNDERFERWE
jgi:hypothetical protein